MNNRVSPLHTRRTVHAIRHEMKINTIKLKTEFISKLRSGLVKNDHKMPRIKHKLSNLKMKRIWSPTTFHDLKQRMKSPHNKWNMSNRRRIKEYIHKHSPINNQNLFIDYTKAQLLLIDKISNRIEEAKSFHGGFRSPRALTRALLKETSLWSSRNQRFPILTNEELTIDNFSNALNRKEFATKILRTQKLSLSL